MNIEPFTWNDRDELVELLKRVQRSEEGCPEVTRETVVEKFALPGLQPQSNCFLLRVGNRLVAYLLVWPELAIERTVLELVISPDMISQSVTARLLRKGLARSRELSASVADLCVPMGSSMTTHLSNLGFVPVRAYWVMRWQGEDLIEVKPPEGFSFLSFHSGETERLTRVQNEAFAGTWGFCPNTVEQIFYRAGMSISTKGGPIFLQHGTETVGYCWTCVVGKPLLSIGTIHMIGIIPSYRARGLSKPLLVCGMHHLRAQGVKWIQLEVDSQNHPAIRLYSSMGFTKTSEIQWFEVSLSTGTGTGSV